MTSILLLLFKFIISVFVIKCSLLWLFSVRDLQGLQTIASGIWRRCSLWLLYVFTWHWCKTFHGSAAPCHTLSQRKCMTSLKMFGPSSWDLFYFTVFSAHLQTSEDLLGFFVVENISKCHHWYCLLT